MSIYYVRSEHVYAFTMHINIDLVCQECNAVFISEVLIPLGVPDRLGLVTNYRWTQDN
jgi:hypothetical protein